MYPVNVSTELIGLKREEKVLFFFFFFLESLNLPGSICPELPPVDNSIFVAKEGEGQILGTYLCKNGYHLVGEKTLFCNASKGWNASAPECRCKFDRSPNIFFNQAAT